MPKNFYCKRLGERIGTVRRKNRLTQEDLAGITLVDRTYIARIEEGRANPSLKILQRIAKKLNIGIHELLNGG